MCGWGDLVKDVEGVLGRCVGTRGVLRTGKEERLLDERCASPSSDKKIEEARPSCRLSV